MLLSFVITKGRQHRLWFNTTGLCKQNAAPALKNEDAQLLDRVSAVGHNECLQRCCLVPKYQPMSIKQAQPAASFLTGRPSTFKQHLVHGEDKPETISSSFRHPTPASSFLKKLTVIKPLIRLFSTAPSVLTKQPGNEDKADPAIRGFWGHAGPNFQSSEPEDPSCAQSSQSSWSVPWRQSPAALVEHPKSCDFQAVSGMTRTPSASDI